MVINFVLPNVYFYIGVGQAGLAERLISIVVICSSGIPFFCSQRLVPFDVAYE